MTINELRDTRATSRVHKHANATEHTPCGAAGNHPQQPGSWATGQQQTYYRLRSRIRNLIRVCGKRLLMQMRVCPFKDFAFVYHFGRLISHGHIHKINNKYRKKYMPAVQICCSLGQNAGLTWTQWRRTEQWH